MTTADASLKIEVVSTGIQEASRALGGLSTSAANAEKRVTKLTSSIDKLMGSMTALAKLQGTATSAAEAHIQKIQGGTAAMQAMTSSATATTKTLQQLQSQATKTGNAFGHSHEKANILNNTIKSMMAAASAYIGINFAKSIIQQADAWQMQQAKLNNAVGSMERARGVQQELFDLSQKIRVPLEDSVKLYTRMAVPMQKLGYNTQDTKSMVESLSLALQLNGSTAAEASSVMLQFSQSIAAGRLNGAEFNAVAEGAPQILRAVEEELKRTGQWAGQSGESLKKMASEGKIGIELMKNALDRALPEWRKQFASLPVTVDSAITQVINSWKRMVGEATLVTNAAKDISTTFQDTSLLIDDLTRTSKILGEEFKDLTGDTNGLSTAAVVIGTVLETLLVLGANVSYVFKGIGREIGAMAAQGVLLIDIITGKAADAGKKWQQFTAIGDAVTADAARARAELDAFEKRIVGMTDRVDQRKRQMNGALALGSGVDRAVEDARFSRQGFTANDPFVGAKSLNDVRKHAKIREDIIKESNENILDLEKSFGKAVRDATSEAERKSLAAELAERKMQISKTLAKELESFDKKPKRQKTAAEKAAEEAEEKALKQAQKDAEARSDFRKKDYEAVQDYLEGERSAYNAINKEANEYASKVAESSKILELEYQTLSDSAVSRETALEHLKIQLELERKILEVKKLGVSEEEKNSTIGRLTEIAAKDKANASVKAEIKAQEEIQKEWEKTVDKIDDVFRDGFADMLNNGKSAWKSFTKSLATTFKTMIAESVYKSFAKPLVLNIIGNVAGAMGMSGVSQAAMKAAGGGSALSTAASIGSTVASVGSMIGSSSLGAFGSGMGMTASQVAGATGAAAVEAGVGVTGTAATAMQAGSVAGSAVSSLMAAAPYLIALAVLIKGFSSKVVGSGILGSVSGNDFSGSSYQFKKGGFLKGGGKTLTDALDPKVSTEFGNAVEAMSSTFEELGNVTGVGADVLKGFNYEFRLALADFDEEGKKKEIERFMSSMSDSMAMAFVDTFRTAVDTGVQAASRYWTNTIDGERTFSGAVVSQERVSTALDPFIDDMIRIFDAFEGTEGKLAEFTTSLFTLGMSLANNAGYTKLFGEALTFTKLEAVANSGESVVDTFNRIHTVFTATSNVAKMLGKDVNTAFGAVGLGSIEARQRLIDLAGGIEALNNGAAAFMQSFYTEAERTAMVAVDVMAAMSSLGLASIETKDQFKSLVKGLNLASKADAELYTKLMQLAPAFAQVADAAESATKEALENAKANVNDARSVLEDSYKRESDALQAVIKKFSDFSKSLRKFRDDLLIGSLSNLSPEAKYLELKNRFEKTSALARAGDETALGQLEGISQDFLQASQDYFASSMGYTEDFERVRAALEISASAADVQVDVATQQLNRLQTMVDGLIDVDNSVKSVYQAIMELIAAMRSAGMNGGSSNAVNAMYNNMLGRAPEAGAVDFWNDQISKTSLGSAAAAIALSPEATARMTSVTSLYEGLLGRAPEAGAVSFWEQQIQNGMSFEQVRQSFVGSPEFQGLHGSHKGGLDYVPFDGYRAELHKGERVQTADEASAADQTAMLLKEVLVELKAQTRQGAAVAGETVDRLERVADKLDKNARKIAATTAD